VLELVGLTAAARRRFAQYSLGMRQRLGAAQALLGDRQRDPPGQPQGADPTRGRHRGDADHQRDEGGGRPPGAQHGGDEQRHMPSCSTARSAAVTNARLTPIRPISAAAAAIATRAASTIANSGPMVTAP
jgi:hypothetical protein